MRYLLLAGALFGCASASATVPDAEPMEPPQNYTSFKPSRAVVQCLVKSIQGRGSPSVVRRGDETQITYRAEEKVSLQLSVRSSEDVTDIMAREASGFASQAQIESCV